MSNYSARDDKVITMPKDVNFQTNFGRVVIGKRESLEFSMSKLSEMTGLDIGTISRVENGKVSPLFVSVVRLMDALSIDLSVMTKEVYKLERRSAESNGNEDNRQAPQKQISLKMKKIRSAFVHSRQRSLDWLLSYLNQIHLVESCQCASEIPKFQVADIERLIEPTMLYTYQIHTNPYTVVDIISELIHWNHYIDLSDAQRLSRDFMEQERAYYSLKRGERELVQRLTDGAVDRVKFDAMWRLSETTKIDFVSLYWCAFREKKGDLAEFRFCMLALKIWYWLREDAQQSMLDNIPCISNN